MQFNLMLQLNRLHFSKHVAIWFLDFFCDRSSSVEMTLLQHFWQKFFLLKYFDDMRVVSKLASKISGGQL